MRERIVERGQSHGCSICEGRLQEAHGASVHLLNLLVRRILGGLFVLVMHCMIVHCMALPSGYFKRFVYLGVYLTHVHCWF